MLVFLLTVTVTLQHDSFDACAMCLAFFETAYGRRALVAHCLDGAFNCTSSIVLRASVCLISVDVESYRCT